MPSPMHCGSGPARPLFNAFQVTGPCGSPGEIQGVSDVHLGTEKLTKSHWGHGEELGPCPLNVDIGGRRQWAEAHGLAWCLSMGHTFQLHGHCVAVARLPAAQTLWITPSLGSGCDRYFTRSERPAVSVFQDSWSGTPGGSQDSESPHQRARGMASSFKCLTWGYVGASQRPTSTQHYSRTTGRTEKEFRVQERRLQLNPIRQTSCKHCLQAWFEPGPSLAPKERPRGAVP